MQLIANPTPPALTLVLSVPAGQASKRASVPKLPLAPPQTHPHSLGILALSLAQPLHLRLLLVGQLPLLLPLWVFLLFSLLTLFFSVPLLGLGSLLLLLKRQFWGDGQHIWPPGVSGEEGQLYQVLVVVQPTA